MIWPDWLLSGNAHDIAWWQMSIRAVVVFAYGVIVIRLAGRRAFGKNSAIDIVLAIIIGSSLSRALTGAAALLPTLAAMTVLVFLHELLAHLSLYQPWIGFLAKGEARRIVNDGQPDDKLKRARAVTDRDLMEAVRLHGRTASLQDVAEAWLERNGQISVILRRRG